MATILSEANDILIDSDGHRAYLTDDSLYVYTLLDVNVPPSYLTTNSGDLNEPSVDKLLNCLDIDYSSSGLSIAIYYEDVYKFSLSVPASANRTSKQLWVPLQYRMPVQKLKIKVINTTLLTTLYGLEVDFNIIKRRFHD